MSDNKRVNAMNVEVANIDDSGKDSFSLYIYFSKHPGLFLSVLSILSAILAFIGTLILYLTQAEYLRFFNVSSLLVDVSTKSQAYNLISVALCLLVVFLSSGFVTLYLSRANDPIKEEAYNVRDAKRLSKEIIDMDASILEAKEFVSLPVEIQQEIKDYILESDVHRFDPTALIKEIYSVLWKLYIILYKRLLPIIFGSTLLLVILSAPFTGARSLLFFFIIPVWYFLFYCANYWRKFFRYLRNATKVGDDIEKAGLNKDNFKYLMGKRFSEYLTNRNIYSAILVAVIFIIILSGSGILYGYSRASSTRDFSIYTIDKQVYAQVYLGNNHVVLEEAVINDDSITIYTNNQRVIHLYDYPYTKQSFENVTIVRD